MPPLLRRLLAPLVVCGLLAQAVYVAWHGPDPVYAVNGNIRGGDLVSFWVGGTMLARHQDARLYAPKATRPLVKELAREHPPIYPVGYPPPIYQLFALPQPHLDYFDAAKAIVVLLVPLQALVAAFVVRQEPALRRWAPEAFAVLTLMPAAVDTLGVAQPAQVWTAVVVGGLALARSRPVPGGVVLGLLFVKPTLVLPITLTLVLLGEGRTVAGMVTGGALVLALSLAAGGMTAWRGYLTWLSDPGHAADAYMNHWGRELGLRALLAFRYKKEAVADVLSLVGMGLGTAVAVVYAVWARRTLGTDRRALAFGAVLTAAVCGSAHVLEYDEGLLLPAFVATAVHLLTGRARHPAAGVGAAVLAWFAPVCVPLNALVGVQLVAASLVPWLIWLGVELRGATRQLA